MTNIKRLKQMGVGAAGIALLTLLPTSSFGASIGGVNEARLPASVHKVEYRCWWNEGERICGDFDERPSYSPRVYGYYYGPNSEYRSGPATPDDYRTGSRAWWNSMERWGRSGAQ